MENNLLNQKRKRSQSNSNEEEQNNPKKSKDELLLNSKNDIQETNDEDNMSEFIFKLNTKTSGIECFICHKDISKNIKFLCSECGNKIFCTKCLVLKKHSPEHKFQVIDNLNFPFFTKDWSVKDEYNLLHNLSISGLNNWEDVSNIINKGQTDCEAHYYSFYYKDKDNSIPKKEEIIILDDKENPVDLILHKNKEKYDKNLENINKTNAHINSFKEPAKEIKPNKRAGRYIGLRKNLKPGEAETAAEILGCRPKRHEFETEFLNDTEIEISHLEFDDKDTEEDKKIKIDVLKDYNLRIKEREERKNFVFEKGLLDLRRENRIESKLNREQFELLLFLKPFARFYENSDFFDLFEGICLEQELKNTLKNLNKLEKEKTTKGEKIHSLEELENFFDVDKHLKKTRKSGDIITDIPEPKNLKTYLGHRLDRFMNYQRRLNEQNENKDKNDIKREPIFEEDEYKLVKEMPLPRSTFYDIKLEANKIIEHHKEQRSFIEYFNKLLDEYDLEEKTKSEISEFYIKKFKTIFEEHVKNINEERQEKNNLNINNGKYIDSYKLNDNENNLINSGEKDKQNKNKSLKDKINSFNKTLDDENYKKN